MRALRFLGLLLVLALVPARLAAAAPAPAPATPAPANDDRAKAQAVPSLPASLSGTLVGATAEGGDDVTPSVWYRYIAATDGRFTAQLSAAGDLDGNVTAYRQQRSSLVPLGADDTDDKGMAGLAFNVGAGQTVVIRVAARTGSVLAPFSLVLSAASTPVKPPGTRLPDGGATSTLDRVLHPADAYNFSMREGVTYRINMVPVTPPPMAQPAADPNDPDGRTVAEAPPCGAVVSMYAPGTSDFDAEPISSGGCDSYRLFTPARREGGRYIFRVFASDRTSGPQRYHLQIAPADETDTAPGTFMTNHVTLNGALDAQGVDRVDLYRFQIKGRSRLKLSLATSASVTMTLRNDKGGRVQVGTSINREIAPGRYFVTVEAQAGSRGRYRIRRSSRIITRSTISISGVARARARLNQTVTVGVRLRPAVGGPVRLTFERFDPEAGWLFLRSVDVSATAGRARYGFTPPSVGRFRVRAAYLGTKESAGSETGLANVLVVGRTAP